jgi:hypothetical protein
MRTLYLLCLVCAEPALGQLDNISGGSAAFQQLNIKTYWKTKCHSTTCMKAAHRTHVVTGAHAMHASTDQTGVTPTARQQAWKCLVTFELGAMARCLVEPGIAAATSAPALVAPVVTAVLQCIAAAGTASIN